MFSPRSFCHVEARMNWGLGRHVRSVFLLLDFHVPLIFGFVSDLPNQPKSNLNSIIDNEMFHISSPPIKMIS